MLPFARRERRSVIARFPQVAPIAEINEKNPRAQHLRKIRCCISNCNLNNYSLITYRLGLVVVLSVSVVLEFRL